MSITNSLNPRAGDVHCSHWNAPESALHDQVRIGAVLRQEQHDANVDFADGVMQRRERSHENLGRLAHSRFIAAGAGGNHAGASVFASVMGVGPHSPAQSPGEEREQDYCHRKNSADADCEDDRLLACDDKRMARGQVFGGLSKQAWFLNYSPAKLMHGTNARSVVRQPFFCLHSDSVLIDLAVDRRLHIIPGVAP